MRLRSNFTASMHTRGGSTIIKVWDHCNQKGGMSVTNDAEAVVEYCLKQYGKHPIYYQDTEGCWDELCHDGEKFTHFAPIPPAIKQDFDLK